MIYKSNLKNLTLLFCLTFITTFSTNIFSMEERENNESDKSNSNRLLESAFGDFSDYSTSRNLSESRLDHEYFNEEAEEEECAQESNHNVLTESTLDFGAFTDEEEIDSENNLELGTNLKNLPNEIKLYIIEQLITKRTPLNIVIKAIKSFLLSCKTNKIFIEQNSIILANKIFQVYGPLEILLLPTIPTILRKKIDINRIFQDYGPLRILLLPTIPTILKNLILEKVSPVNLESIYIEFIEQILLNDKLNLDEKREKANLFFTRIQEIKNACIFCSFLGEVVSKPCTSCRRLANLESQIESYLNGKIDLNDLAKNYL